MTDGNHRGSDELAALEKVLLDESTDPVNLPSSLLKAITGNFSESHEIGRGGFGVVYKGVLPSGRTVAVKQLFERYEILDKTFDSEIDCIAGLKHKNTVRFLGYSSETQYVRRWCDGKLQWVATRQRLLCFEYLPKGCLAPYISDASCGLHWTTRYQIIKGICEGVHYLHQHRIIHRDLKPQNVLLDDNMIPKIADFGLSRHLSESQSRDITENKFGTMGYMAPEFFNKGEITFKTDVYSLGAIIMDILMGQKECSDVKEVVESWTDKFGTSKSHTSQEEVKLCAEIGIKCRNYDPRNRPATWSIIHGILDEAEISNWSVTSDVATSTEGQIRLASMRADELKLMDDSATPSQQQASTLEVGQEGGKVSQERKRKSSTISFSKMADELRLMGDSAAPSQLQPSALEVEQEDGKVSQEKKRKTSFFGLADEKKLIDDSAAPSQLQPLAREVELVDGKVSLEREGKAASVSVVTGVISTPSGKLDTLMCDEYNKHKEVRKQVSFLENELSSINAALEQLELMDELALVVKNWRDDVREISYDMQNCIDDFMCQFGGEDAEVGLIEEAAELHKRLSELHGIANQMGELRSLVVEANARRESYKIDDCNPSFGYVSVDARLRAVYQEATNLVGIEGPSKEVVSLLMNTQKKLKVVSIVGFGGLGKTTLAKQVFNKITGHFGCLAFFSVSQRPDLRMLLNRLQLKLGINVSSHNCGLDDIIEKLRKYLTDKRYLIVVDDLWDQSAWKTISCAFPQNGNGSRIILTTRVEDVASIACNNDRECIYTMKPLSEHNSRMLFSNRVFGSEVVCPPHLKDVAAEILKKCGGMPLAIITIASLLATQVKSRKHWESIRKYLRVQPATNPSLEEIKSILNLSYKHLPLHLRACYLYLGMYPEDHIIIRDQLVKQWIAEGLVSSLHGPDLEDVGRSYFNELVNRSMIQPSEISYGEVLSCTVHDMMLDLILSKCVEDNFISVAYNSEDMARLLHRCKNKVRRLSLSSMAVGGATYDTAIAARLSRVRSLLFKKGCNPILPLLWFKYLRVLILLNERYRWKIVDLTAVSQLFHLRCLMVSVYVEIKLPTKLGELVYLETMDIENCKLLERIPSDIVRLPRLSYLLLPTETKLPEGIGNMKSLRTLRGLDMKKSSLECFMGLGELTNLRDLRMSIDIGLELPKVDALACSIGKLYNLEYLFISGNLVEREDSQQLGSLFNPLQHIEHLELPDWRLWRVPKWLCGLHCLRFLELYVEKTSTQDVHLLGELPCLVYLDFEACEIPDERAMLGAGLFPVLVSLKFWSSEDTTAYLGFEAGAMPSLRTLWMAACHWGGTAPVGMEHLLHLQQIQVRGVCNYKDTDDAFKEALLMHPNRPSVTIHPL
ncbi:disease resistance protein RGA5-like [Triticum dicoccoides]|uniref:disease resistance protein RGA5-like n=1 Tax=Triticum dicoccoides TaxID=85692 RepID=UPI00188EC2A0|nr:disease resistance protein RGA5-like [Triticum dicoccoides]